LEKKKERSTIIRSLLFLTSGKVRSKKEKSGGGEPVQSRSGLLKVGKPSCRGRGKKRGEKKGKILSCFLQGERWKKERVRA